MSDLIERLNSCDLLPRSQDYLFGPPSYSRGSHVYALGRAQVIFPDVPDCCYENMLYEFTGCYRKIKLTMSLHVEHFTFHQLKLAWVSHLKPVVLEEFKVVETGEVIRRYWDHGYLIEETLRVFFSNFLWCVRVAGWRRAYVATVRIADTSGVGSPLTDRQILATARNFMDSLRIVQ